jgi:hypothetical protein
MPFEADRGVAAADPQRKCACVNSPLGNGHPYSHSRFAAAFISISHRSKNSRCNGSVQSLRQFLGGWKPMYGTSVLLANRRRSRIFLRQLAMADTHAPATKTATDPRSRARSVGDSVPSTHFASQLPRRTIHKKAIKASTKRSKAVRPKGSGGFHIIRTPANPH